MSKCETCGGSGKHLVETIKVRGVYVKSYEACPDCNGTGIKPYKCLSCPTMITTGDYCSQCSDTPDGRSDAVEDIMDFVEPKEYLKTEDSKIYEAFQKTVQYKNAHSPEQASERFFLYGIGAKSRQQEIEELQDIISIQKEDLENTRIISSEKDKEISIFAKLVIEYDKQIEELQEELKLYKGMVC